MSIIKQGEDLSVNEREFILAALKDTDYRADGRTTRDTRPLRMTYARAEGQASAEIQLGKTRVLTVVTGEINPPYPDRPTEGFLNLNVEYSPMATLGIDNARSSPTLVEVDRVIERCLRQSRAMDTEALCVIAGHKVWSLRCDVRILDDCGNVVDAACLATVAALLHFRLPEVTVLTGSGGSGGGSGGNDEAGAGDNPAGASVIVHHSFEKEPSALPIHHVPICVSFGLFHESPVIAAVDPTHREEAVMGGRLTYSINVHKELCALQKIGGVPLAPTDLLRWAEVATAQVGEWHALLQTSLEAADKRAKEERLRCVRGTASVDVAAPAAAPAVPEPPAPPPALPAGIAHLDFAELHVPIKVRQESEKPPVNLEEEARNLGLLEQAAKEAERYRVAQAPVAQKESNQKKEAQAAAAAAVTSMEVEEEEEEAAQPPPPATKETSSSPSPSKKAKRGGDRVRDTGKTTKKKAATSSDEDEEEEAAVLTSEFAAGNGEADEAAAEASQKKKPTRASKATASSSLAARRAKVTLEGNEEEDEEGGNDDLMAAVKKPRVSKSSSEKNGAKGGGRTTRSSKK